MKLVVGLGNPGIEYNNTRHNIGFMMLDEIIKKQNISTSKIFKNGEYFEFMYNNEKVILLKPLSYMNLSGEVIRKYVNYFKINIEDILVIYDDMDLKVGNFKIKFEGSSAGHNGIKNIVQNLKTDKFKRVKVGISKHNCIDAKNYVLGKFSKSELSQLEEIKTLIPKIIEDFMCIDFEKVMSKYNKKNK